MGTVQYLMQEAAQAVLSRVQKGILQWEILKVLAIYHQTVHPYLIKVARNLAQDLFQDKRVLATQFHPKVALV